MHYRLRRVATVLAVGVLAPLLAFGQSQSQSDAAADPGWELPRLPSGQPDLRGYWTTQTFTPMERPEYLGDQAFYSEEEWAQLQAQLTVEGADPLARHVITIADAEERGRVLDQTHRKRDLRPLRQCRLAGDACAQGVVDPANLSGPPTRPKGGSRRATHRPRREP